MSPRGEVNRRDDQIKLLHRNLSFTGTCGYTTLNAPSTRGVVRPRLGEVRSPPHSEPTKHNKKLLLTSSKN
jgi:hypothetical protein